MSDTRPWSCKRDPGKKLCGARDPDTDVDCLLHEDHYLERQTMHRGVFHTNPESRLGVRVLWGPGREVWTR